MLGGQIIGNRVGLVPSLNPWLVQGQGEGVGTWVRPWMQSRFDAAVQGIFGYHALQLGASLINSLSNSRIPHRWCAADTVQDTRASLYANASALPFFESTLDLVTLPFTLDAHSDPESVLDEVARVLVPEGRAVFCGLNHNSLWGAAALLGQQVIPADCQPYGYKRLLAALPDVGLQVDFVQMGGYMPPVSSSRAAQEWQWLENLGGKYWPSFGALYFVVARRRIMGLRPKRRAVWRLPKLADLLLNPFPNPNPASGLRKDKSISI